MRLSPTSTKALYGIFEWLMSPHESNEWSVSAKDRSRGEIDGGQINDLNATVLHCLGIDHARFTYRFQGLEQRLTGVEEQQVIGELLA